ncbi:hypothetical protein K437DRAFT_255437 [Tilletiaria anomala UBC 951]|uniref:Uncharacterized protein n=1 Tax=Tilletiaria anomala (strain ATCC 24038 / CBS 436.72 / UBC 951) TaxID=1037660 RepID=A0A066W595_TILAU|nr:uncharacterized protein K437DRAFT_255437 [Tilletiaria anomala UBC 951]KDN48881.1 hypothetical protein K437DRAFT_255437 [Tilletiaria anomala UBC 951]
MTDPAMGARSAGVLDDSGNMNEFDSSGPVATDLLYRWDHDGQAKAQHQQEDSEQDELQSQSQSETRARASGTTGIGGHEQSPSANASEAEQVPTLQTDHIGDEHSSDDGQDAGLNRRRVADRTVDTSAARTNGSTAASMSNGHTHLHRNETVKSNTGTIPNTEHNGLVVLSGRAATLAHLKDTSYAVKADGGVATARLSYTKGDRDFIINFLCTTDLPPKGRSIGEELARLNPRHSTQSYITFLRDNYDRGMHLDRVVFARRAEMGAAAAREADAQRQRDEAQRRREDSVAADIADMREHAIDEDRLLPLAEPEIEEELTYDRNRSTARGLSNLTRAAVRSRDDSTGDGSDVEALNQAEHRRSQRVAHPQVPDYHMSRHAGSMGQGNEEWEVTGEEEEEKSGHQTKDGIEVEPGPGEGKGLPRQLADRTWSGHRLRITRQGKAEALASSSQGRAEASKPIRRSATGLTAQVQARDLAPHKSTRTARAARTASDAGPHSARGQDRTQKPGKNRSTAGASRTRSGGSTRSFAPAAEEFRADAGIGISQSETLAVDVHDFFVGDQDEDAEIDINMVAGVESGNRLGALEGAPARQAGRIDSLSAAEEAADILILASAPESAPLAELDLSTPQPDAEEVFQKAAKSSPKVQGKLLRSRRKHATTAGSNVKATFTNANREWFLVPLQSLLENTISELGENVVLDASFVLQPPDTFFKTIAEQDPAHHSAAAWKHEFWRHALQYTISAKVQLNLDESVRPTQVVKPLSVRVLKEKEKEHLEGQIHERNIGDEGDQDEDEDEEGLQIRNPVANTRGKGTSFRHVLEAQEIFIKESQPSMPLPTLVEKQPRRGIHSVSMAGPLKREPGLPEPDFVDQRQVSLHKLGKKRAMNSPPSHSQDALHQEVLQDQVPHQFDTLVDDVSSSAPKKQRRSFPGVPSIARHSSARYIDFSQDASAGPPFGHEQDVAFEMRPPRRTIATTTPSSLPIAGELSRAQRSVSVSSRIRPRTSLPRTKEQIREDFRRALRDFRNDYGISKGNMAFWLGEKVNVYSARMRIDAELNRLCMETGRSRTQLVALLKLVEGDWDKFQEVVNVTMFDD